MADILLVEDDNTLGMTLQMTLTASGHTVRLATSLAAGREALAERLPDLLVLDLGLPDGDGITLCRELREANHQTSILILTARGTLQARVEGLTAGADDYLTKPFELPELLARVQALVRRSGWRNAASPATNSSAEAPQEFTIGRLTVNKSGLEGRVNGESLNLTDLEVRLLCYLWERAGEIVSRDALLQDVWRVDPNTRTRTVDVFIGRLRRYIEEESSQPKHLVGVRGVGYRLVLEP